MQAPSLSGIIPGSLRDPKVKEFISGGMRTFLNDEIAKEVQALMGVNESSITEQAPDAGVSDKETQLNKEIGR